MTDSAVPITAGVGTNIDTRQESTNSHHRQVIVVGDPSTNAGVAPVDATAGLKVNLGADNDVTVTGTVAVTQSGAWAVTVSTAAVTNAGTFAVQEDGAALTALQAVQAAVEGTLTVGAHAVTNAGTFAVQAAQSGAWTVTANLSATDNAVLDTIAASLVEIEEAQASSDTGTASQVADSSSDATILAANADRRGAGITNDSSAVLYLLVAAGTASATNYTVSLNQGDYYEVPAGYTGIIKGIWASDPGDGAARVTEWDNA